MGTPRLISVRMRPSCHTLSNAFSTSINMAAEKCFIFLTCMAVCVSWKILPRVDLCAGKPACSSLSLLLLSAHLVNFIFIILSNILDKLSISEMGL